MATIGQVIYNLEDYHSSGGYISTSSSNHNSTITSQDSNYQNNRFNIYEDVVAGYGATEFTKLGIQAPPGTKVELNSTKTIMIGRTGVYELDEDISITSLKFQQSKLYEIDTAATEASLNEGINELQQAKDTLDAAIAELDQRKEDTGMAEVDYWQEYNTIYDEYETSYEVALAKFNSGLNGIYKLPNPDNPDAAENYQDLVNVIIDFIY